MEYLDDVCYEINGHVYRFIRVRVVDGELKGYSRRLKKWCWLYPTFILPEGEAIVAAKLV